MMQQKSDNLKPVIGIIGGTGKLGGWFAGFFESNNLPVLICGKNTGLKPRDVALIEKIYKLIPSTTHANHKKEKSGVSRFFAPARCKARFGY